VAKQNPPSVSKAATRRATAWAEALTFRDREVFIREVAPQVAEMQAKLAACRRLNKKGSAPDVSDRSRKDSS